MSVYVDVFILKQHNEWGRQRERGIRTTIMRNSVCYQLVFEHTQSRLLLCPQKEIKKICLPPQKIRTHSISDFSPLFSASDRYGNKYVNVRKDQARLFFLLLLTTLRLATNNNFMKNFIMGYSASSRNRIFFCSLNVPFQFNI